MSVDAQRTSVKIGEHRESGPMKNKTTELKIVFGVTVDTDKFGEMIGGLGLTTIKKGSAKPRIKEVFVQFDGDAKSGGLTLGDLGLGKIPVANDIAINGLGIGFSPAVKGGDGFGFYLYSALTWTKPNIAGQLGIMKRDKDFYVMTRVTEFSLQKIVDTLPTKTQTALSPFSKPFKAFEMPNAMLVFSTAKGDDSRGGALNLSDLPGQLQTMFNGIVKEGGPVPIYGDGISIIGGIDVSKDENLRKSIEDLGIDTTGPIVLGGSLGGFDSGNLKLAMYLDIPKVNLPNDKEMDGIIHATSAGAKFFISVDAAGPAFKTGISADVEMSLPRVAGNEQGPDLVAMGGDFYLNIDAVGVGVRFAGYTRGDCHDPLGFEDITLKETAILIGTDFSGGLEVGLGTTLSFNLTSTGGGQVKGKDYGKVFKKGEIKKRLQALQARMESDEVAKADVDFSAGFITAWNTTPALGIPVPKKVGVAFKNSRLSLPNTIDIFDLFIKGLVSGPWQDKLLENTKPNSPQRKVLDTIIGGYKDGKWVPASQKVEMVSPVPLDLVYFENVDLFFATPGAILPGYTALDGNIGLRLAGDVWVKNAKNTKKKRVARANIDLTLNGLNFGAIRDQLKAAYQSIAAASIDPLRAEFDCPKGAFYDVLESSCWSCPTDYKRTLTPVTASNACKLVDRQKAKATFVQDANLAWSCPDDTFHVSRNKGECWSCPTGYSRGLKAVDGPEACYEVDLSKISSYSKATKHKKATGMLGTTCGKGQFWHFGDGYCYSCPDKYSRTAKGIKHEKACMNIGKESVTDRTVATLVKPGKPAGSFLHLGKGKFYSCPKGYKRTAFGVDSDKACQETTVSRAEAKSESRGQIKTKTKKGGLCFGVEDKRLTVGDPVVMQECFDEDSRFQSWYKDSLERLRPLKQLSLKAGEAARMCLDVDEERSQDGGITYQDGATLKIAKCLLKADINFGAQNWFVDEKDRIVRTDGNQCLSAGKLGEALRVTTCSNDENQFWEFGKNIVKPKDIKAAEFGPIMLTSTGERELCLQMVDAGKAGSELVMEECLGEDNQRWHWSAKGQLSDEAKEFCLDLSKDADGAALVMKACRSELDNVDSQRWSDDEIERIANDKGRCMDFADGDTEGLNATVTVNACQEGTANQMIEMMDAPKEKVFLPFIKMSEEQREKMAAAQERISQNMGNLLAGVFSPKSMVHTVATKHQKATKLSCPKPGKDEPKQFWVPKDGFCYSCPNKFTRTAHSIASDKACIGRVEDAGELTISVPWKLVPGGSVDIAIGSIGDVWVIGTNDKIYYRDFPAGKWVPVSGSASKVAVGKDSDVWVVNSKNQIYRGGINGFTIISGGLTDIAAGADGTVWGIGTRSAGTDGKEIYKRVGDSWRKQSGAAVQIAVDPDGNAWLVNAAGDISKGDGTTWTKMPGQAKEVAVGANGAVWIVGKESVSDSGNGVYRWNATKNDWDLMQGNVVTLAVAPSGGPWATDRQNKIHDANPKRKHTPKLTYSCPSDYSKVLTKAWTRADACSKKEFKSASKHTKPTNCPSGQNEQLLGAWKGYCVSCPSGFDRKPLVNAENNGACVKTVTTPASFKRADVKAVSSCPSGYSKGGNNTCFKCPSGYTRNAIRSVTHAKACKKNAARAPASFSGSHGTCASGYKKHVSGNCVKCPSGSERTINAYNGTKACKIAATTTKTDKTAIKGPEAGGVKCPSGQHKNLLPGSSFGYCFSCPSGYERGTATTLTGNKACHKDLTAIPLTSLK